MPVELANWPALALLPIALGLTWWLFHAARAFRHWSRARRRLAFALRAVVLLLLALSLAGVRWRQRIDEQAVVFAVDRSASAEAATHAASDWIGKALAAKGPRDRSAIVGFGADAVVDRPLSATTAWNGLEERPRPHFTDPAAALRLAGGLMPEAARRRVVLLTDGRENQGDALREARHLARQGVRVDVLPLRPSAPDDARVAAVHVPATLYRGEVFDVVAEVHSSVRTQATLRLFADRTAIGETRVELQPGSNRIAFAARADLPGYHSYRVVLNADRDAVAENNTAAAVASVRGQPRALLVEGKPGEARNLESALRGARIETRLVGPAELPLTATELGGYGAVFLVNVPATQLGDENMAALRTYVRDLGGGLAMVGGEESFGLGGYFKTPVEEALPVYMDLRGKAQLPSLGLVVVVDKSGSMGEWAGGANKMELAKEAAARSTEVLTPRDRVGVVAFDSAAKWVVDLRPVDDVAAIRKQIGTIQPGGGTDIYPGLYMAFEALKDSPTKLRHIILLTDGVSATGGDYQQLADEMKKHRITLSTVAVGFDSDRLLLDWLAKIGGGRHYFTNELSSIPKIFTKETMLATRTFIVDKTFAPAVVSPSPILRGLTAGVPPLDGYIATSPKEAAEVVLVSPEGDPVLAQWQYGLGRSVAWTSDARGRWTGKWIGAPQYQRLWAQITSWVLPQAEGGLWSVDASARAGRVDVNVRGPENATGADGGTSLAGDVRATLIDPDGKSRALSLSPLGPGRYRAEADVADPGVYFVQVEGQGGGRTTPVVVPYSPEYREVGADPSFLERFAAAGGGKVLNRPAEAFAPDLPPAYAVTDLWPLLLALAIVLFPLDVAARRLTVSASDLRAGWAWALNRVPVLRRAAVASAAAREAAVVVEERIGRLRQSKAATGAAIAGRPAAPPPAPPAGVSRPSAPAGAKQASGGTQPGTGNSPATTPGNAPAEAAFTSRLLDAKRRNRR